MRTIPGELRQDRSPRKAFHSKARSVTTGGNRRKSQTQNLSSIKVSLQLVDFILFPYLYSYIIASGIDQTFLHLKPGSAGGRIERIIALAQTNQIIIDAAWYNLNYARKTQSINMTEEIHKSLTL
ncbi:uncharacterized protein LAJ45_00735 [Morchella importuna]|uniref:uncharacterized protein n=1 Tax=Morchella importuna TaxID=1174673 RepID=UPI001E8E58A0|nr:uncharacterized protein LAJ45_00735 [Morchella importuna]KAH8155725.1 hypothetical protein LAJ45_00735 [Morchella importuna]